MNANNIKGKKFNHLTAIKLDRIEKRKGGGTNHFWLFECDCGKKTIVRKGLAISGNIKSCGCIKFIEVNGVKRIKNHWKGRDCENRVISAIRDGQMKMKGKHTKERIEKHSNDVKQWHKDNNHPMLGKKHTKESREKISISLKGNIPWDKGKKRPEITGEKHPNYIDGRTFNRQIYYQIHRAMIRDIGGSFTKKDWENLKKKYGYMCLCCKQSEPEIKLTIDHIVPVSIWKEWAEKNKPYYKGGDIENIQPLCLRCNQIKHIKYINYKETFSVRNLCQN